MKTHRACTVLAAATVLLSLSLIAPAPAPAQANYEPYAFTTFAGLMGGRGNTDGTGSAARFSNPQGVAVDSSGNNAIRKGTVGPQYLWQVDRLRCGPNGNMRLLWRHLYGGNPDGQVSLWTLDNNAGNPSSPTIGPISGWTVAELLVSGNDSTPHLVWTNTTAAISLWRFNASGALENAVYYGPY